MGSLPEPLMCQIVGSYSKPAWFLGENHARQVDRFDLSSSWVPDAGVLAAAQGDAARLAIWRNLDKRR